MSEGSAVAEGARNAAGAWTAVGEGLSLGLLSALIAALPAATRLPGVSSFVVLWASAALLVGPVAAGMRLARPRPNSEAAANMTVGQSARRAAAANMTVALGVMLASTVLVVFAGVLKTSTHHRPLGAITFVVTACVVLLGSIAVAGRWLGLARDAASARVRTVARITLTLAAGAALLAVLASVFRAVSDASVRTLLLDAALLVAAVALGARLRVPSALGRLVDRVLPVTWLALIASGLALGRSAELAESVASTAPLLGWLAGF